MPSTFSPSLKLELIGNGEQAGVWGTTTNNNMGTLLEQAITGVITIDVTGLSSYTLTNYNGLSDEARNAVLVFTGSLAAPCTINVPSVEKTYIVANKTTGANAVVIQTTTANTINVSVASQVTAIVYSDGTNVYSATTLNYIDGSLTITGNLTVGGTNYSNGGLSTTSGNLRLTSNTGIIAANASTGAFIVPTGTDGQKPGSPINGMLRYNTSLGYFEGYIEGEWQKMLYTPEGVYTIDYLVVAGGGGGANSGAPGGGGGGGYLASSTTVTPGIAYTFIIGAGGAGSGVSGSSTTFTGIAVAIGGGGGNGGNGGSGGGGGGLGTAGQGYNGGASAGGGAGGGGGGAGGLGASGIANTAGGSGGVGVQNSITGSAIYYAGGGGGGNNLFTGTPSAGSNGLGGGPTANRGGGGQGATINPGPGPDGQNGGSGVVILSIPTISYTGTTTGSPTVTTFGSNTILTYTASGSYTA